MQALIVIDAQNEFSPNGKRPVPNFTEAVGVITKRVAEARQQGTPVAWVRHHNKPDESAAFVPGSWGAEFFPGLGPEPGENTEVEFQKNVYGAFTGTDIGSWLQSLKIDEIVLVGFYTHGCVSTTAREAIMAGLKVSIDSRGTGACELIHETLGNQTADEVRRSALLHLKGMGAEVE